MAKKRIEYDCENLRYLMDFSLIPSLVFTKGPEFCMAICETNGQLLFDMMQDYYEGMINDIKRRNIRLFDPKRIKVQCVELCNDWKVCVVEMPDDINGSSPIFCNAYYIALKMKEVKTKEVLETREIEIETEYDDGYDEEFAETDADEIAIDNGKPYLVRFFTVEEATSKEEITSLPIYEGIAFGTRKLCEIFESGKRKEYGETEKDVLVNLIKVGVLLGAIDEMVLQDRDAFIDKETDEILNDDVESVENPYDGEINLASAEESIANKKEEKTITPRQNKKDIFDDLDEFEENN